jgi:hypothetical protein
VTVTTSGRESRKRQRCSLHSTSKRIPHCRRVITSTQANRVITSGERSSGSAQLLHEEMSKKRELIPFSPCIRRSASGNNLLDGAGFSVDPSHRNAVMEWSVRFSAAQTTQASRWMDFFSAQEHLHPDVARQRM